MTQIDFYILTNKARTDRFHLACRLVDKAWNAGHRVCINTESEQDAAHIDTLLWTFNDQNFIPHDRIDKAQPGITPITIAVKLQTTEEHDILINLASVIPDCFSQFERLLEPVDKDETNRAASRDRYRYYRDCGYTINNHEIN
ncbi:MAG: DNA polymerase III subunit chi [Gammaproteobacteria bacterium]|nr:DNA polymerase III subunit chi [Gammaproteobacteria bacterium]